ncbi:unnamed protein product [Soboliphyme baturini]|uniref:Uncharacterized protein n=1 Tax=Soboliphyme baturini TaxID=241478 RepID=A0A183J9I4_9BILA|nr:unnamed protein product [Soboliphyme baturini]
MGGVKSTRNGAATAAVVIVIDFGPSPGDAQKQELEFAPLLGDDHDDASFWTGPNRTQFRLSSVCHTSRNRRPFWPKYRHPPPKERPPPPLYTRTEPFDVARLSILSGVSTVGKPTTVRSMPPVQYGFVKPVFQLFQSGM